MTRQTLVASATGGVVATADNLAPLENHLRSLAGKTIEEDDPPDAERMVDVAVRAGAVRRMGVAPPTR